MTEIRIGDQTIHYDRKSTAAAYARIERGFAEKCGCDSCKNFLAQRDLAYPNSFRELLEQLGIDSTKEAEAFLLGPVEDGCLLYGGWFNLTGELIEAGERNAQAADSHQFEFFFRRGSTGRLILEFTAHLKDMTRG